MKTIIDFLVNKVFLKGYLSDLIKRLNGYKLFLGLALTALQVAHVITGGDIAILQTIIDAIASANIMALLSPDEIGIVASSLLALWGALHKGVKKAKKLPQVPELVVKDSN